MRVVIQRVSEASVSIEGKQHSTIKKGLLVLCGFENTDTAEDLEWMHGKIINLRIFGDAEGKMNLSLLDIAGEILIVSQFTLHALTKKGNRPSFINASRPETAIPLYEKFIALFESSISGGVKTGSFGADMQVSLLNDGPVTICIDSKNKE